VKSNFAEGRLLFTSDAKEAIEQSEVQFIAVGTPPNEDGSADLKHVLAVAKTIATHMTGYTVVVDKSTVPVGTADKVTDMIARTLKARGVNFAFDVVSNPEFLKEGAAVADCQRPDRIVIGTESVQAENILRELYEPFNRNHDKVIVMNVRSAELTKYAANCMLATKISFMNEMANIAELVGADIESVRQGIGSDQRIGYHFIYPGAGYGGSCFPKDVSALVKTSEGMGYTPWILNAVESRNQAQKHVVFEKIQRYFKDGLKNKTFALWGLSFKPNTDDMREAPSRVVMEALWQAGARVQAFDPAAMEETQHIYGDRPDLMLCGTKEAALMGADALVIMTEWKNFRVPDFERMKSALKTPAIFDGRNLFEPARMRERGFDYFSIGR
jgi:UDPglucose 6-dehydrogenase